VIPMAKPMVSLKGYGQGAPEGFLLLGFYRMDDQDRVLKVISELLEYPDEDFLRRLPDMEARVALLPGEVKNRLADFMTGIKSQDPIRVQETYTSAFYVNPRTTLNMAYHLWGDSERRAQALAGLEAMYREAGYERSSGELPDFLPLVLEFLSISPQARGIELAWQCVGGIERVIAQLEERAPEYAALLTFLAGILSDQVRGGIDRGDHVPEERGHSTGLNRAGACVKKGGCDGPCL